MEKLSYYLYSMWASTGGLARAKSKGWHSCADVPLSGQFTSLKPRV